MPYPPKQPSGDRNRICPDNSKPEAGLKLECEPPDGELYLLIFLLINATMAAGDPTPDLHLISKIVTHD